MHFLLVSMMVPDINSPRPTRLLKRSVKDLVKNDLPRKKCRRSSRPELAVQSSKDLHRKVSASQSSLKRDSAIPKTEINLVLPTSDPAHAPADQYSQQPLPIPSYASSIELWLSNLPSSNNLRIRRPSSAPPRLCAGKALQGGDASKVQPLSTANLTLISPPRPRIVMDDAEISVQNSRTTTSCSSYRDILLCNGIRIDSNGRCLPKAIQDFVNTNILKDRPTMPLSTNAVGDAITMVQQVEECGKAGVRQLINTDIFSVRRSGIVGGWGTLWSREPLPCNDMISQHLSTPKPDCHFGYSGAPQSAFTMQEIIIMNHPVADPYTRPTRGGYFPFLIIVAKSEATGGSLWDAENQLAGSGSHSVNAVRWLLDQASDLNSPVDSVAFTIALSNRTAVLYIHYHVEAEKRFYMSRIANYTLVDPVAIQACHNVTQNILDYGLGKRLTTIKNALGKLFPYPASWKVA